MMNTKTSLFTCVFVWGCLWASGARDGWVVAQSQTPPSSPAAQSSVAPVDKELDAALERIRDEHHLPALAGACVIDGSLRAVSAVGRRKADVDAAVAIDDRFHIGSCTKSMTATLAALLVKDGVIAWNTTIGEVFPDLVDSIKPDYREVTLEQLLTHRSGLPEDRAPDPAIWMKIRSLNGPMIEQRRTVTEPVLSNVEPVAKPGEGFAYSNMGYVIAGAMLEKKTGKSWEELLRTRLFDPLGMTTAGFGPPGGDDEDNTSDSPTQPWAHRVINESNLPIAPGPFADNPAVLGPAGTVHLSLADWAKYAAFHFENGDTSGRDKNGDVLLGADSLKKLHTAPDGFSYAFGWGTGERAWADGRIISHAGSNTMWFAVIWIAPERRCALIAATNIAGDSAPKACDQAVAWMIHACLPDDRKSDDSSE